MNLLTIGSVTPLRRGVSLAWVRKQVGTGDGMTTTENVNATGLYANSTSWSEGDDGGSLLFRSSTLSALQLWYRNISCVGLRFAHVNDPNDATVTITFGVKVDAGSEVQHQYTQVAGSFASILHTASEVTGLARGNHKLTVRPISGRLRVDYFEALV